MIGLLLFQSRLDCISHLFLQSRQILWLPFASAERVDPWSTLALAAAPSSF